MPSLISAISSVCQNYNQANPLKVKLHLCWDALLPLATSQLRNHIYHDRILAGLQSKIVCAWHMWAIRYWLPIRRYAKFPILAVFHFGGIELRGEAEVVVGGR